MKNLSEDNYALYYLFGAKGLEIKNASEPFNIDLFALGTYC